MGQFVDMTQVDDPEDIASSEPVFTHLFKLEEDIEEKMAKNTEAYKNELLKL
jgi:hypothetical protein